MIARIKHAINSAQYRVHSARSYECCCGGKWSKAIEVRTYVYGFFHGFFTL